MCPFCNKQFVAEGNTETRPLPRVEDRKAEAAKPAVRPRKRGPRERGTRRRAPARRAPAKTAPREEPEPKVRRRPLFDIPPETMRVIRIMSLTLVLIVAISGLVLLVSDFSAATLVGSTKELFNDMVSAAKNRDKDDLWALMTRRDQGLAGGREAELKRYLTEVAEISSREVSMLGSKGLILACLRSPQFGLASWEYRRSIEKDETGEVVFDDYTGKSRTIPIVHMAGGWRLALTRFCLKRIRTIAAASAGPPRPAAESDDAQLP